MSSVPVSSTEAIPTCYCLRAGTQFDGRKGRYEIIQTIRHLVHGDIYKVKYIEGKSVELVIVKTESNSIPDSIARLKKEVGILQDVNAERLKGTGKFQQFPICLDRGRANFKFLVLKMVGPDLHFLRTKLLKKNFSKSTAFRIAQWSLQAIVDLHEIGWIHRDIRPANFWIGYGLHNECIYLFDFLKIRQVVRKGKHTPKREGLQTDVQYTHYKFLSRAAAQGYDQSRRDDYEMWAYMVVDLFDMSALPWRDLKRQQDIIRSKIDFFASKKVREVALREIPDFEGVFDYIKRMHFTDEGRPSLFRDYLKTIKKRYNINVNEPLDWNHEMATQHALASTDTSSYPHVESVDNLASSGSGLSRKRSGTCRVTKKPSDKKEKQESKPQKKETAKVIKKDADEEDDLMKVEGNNEKAYVRADMVVKGITKKKPRKCQEEDVEAYDNVNFA
ncbi:unnamed protein product, partial [Mesorhabditis belari]|uniref:Protein kinase domain-containing protein n=1 Tax=Mesorhabditis belari TaxID=2138241 RepID=A0AAF3FPF8_9BILA